MVDAYNSLDGLDLVLKISLILDLLTFRIFLISSIIRSVWFEFFLASYLFIDMLLYLMFKFSYHCFTLIVCYLVLVVVLVSIICLLLCFFQIFDFLNFPRNVILFKVILCYSSYFGYNLIIDHLFDCFLFLHLSLLQHDGV